MPVTEFFQNTFSQFADKAQDAINKTPLAQHIPPSLSGRRSASPGNTEAGGQTRSGPLGQLQHQFRTFQIQYGYGSATPVQRIITTEKGVALDLDSVKRDAHVQSKEMYMWGQHEASDLKDITDRLAWLNYVTGSLAGTIADKLNAARGPLKALRNNDAALAPRRNARAALQTQIDRLEQGKEKGYEKRIVELRAQLCKAEEDDAPSEREAEILKRKALRESELLKFEALREFGEKLSLISQASGPILESLPSIPPTAAQPYDGAEKSGNVRATLQHALDNWKPGDTTLRATAGAMLDRSHTRSFGETHAMELSKIDSDQPHAGVTPLGSPSQQPKTPPTFQRTAASPVPPSSSVSTSSAVQEKDSAKAASLVPASVPVSASATSTPVGATSPVPQSSPTASRTNVPPVNPSGSPPIDPNTLNNSPAPIPSSPPVVTPPRSAAPNPAEPEVKIPSVTPTIAETGVPIQAKSQDPGPASGSLKDLRSPTSAPGSSAAASPGTHESAEEEKKRLEREERERVLRASASTAPAPSSSPKYESAEEEKKRLEREERERLLRGDGPQPPPKDHHGDGDDAMPPPYQDF